MQLEKVYSGNAVTVGVYKFTAAENADTTAVRKFVINELRHWCANRQNLSRLHTFLKAFEAVNRHTGGLEKSVCVCGRNNLVNRHTGGLEIR